MSTTNHEGEDWKDKVKKQLESNEMGRVPDWKERLKGMMTGKEGGSCSPLRGRMQQENVDLKRRLSEEVERRKKAEDTLRSTPRRILYTSSDADFYASSSKGDTPTEVQLESPVREASPTPLFQKYDAPQQQQQQHQRQASVRSVNSSVVSHQKTASSVVSHQPLPPVEQQFPPLPPLPPVEQHQRQPSLKTVSSAASPSPLPPVEHQRQSSLRTASSVASQNQSVSQPPLINDEQHETGPPLDPFLIPVGETGPPPDPLLVPVEETGPPPDSFLIPVEETAPPPQEAVETNASKEEEEEAEEEEEEEEETEYETESSVPGYNEVSGRFTAGSKVFIEGLETLARLNGKEGVVLCVVEHSVHGAIIRVEVPGEEKPIPLLARNLLKKTLLKGQMDVFEARFCEGDKVVAFGLRSNINGRKGIVDKTAGDVVWVDFGKVFGTVSVLAANLRYELSVELEDAATGDWYNFWIKNGNMVLEINGEPAPSVFTSARLTKTGVLHILPFTITIPEGSSRYLIPRLRRYFDNFKLPHNIPNPSPEIFPVGSVVGVVGLVHNARLNGMKGTVVGVMCDKNSNNVVAAVTVWEKKNNNSL
eukprot:TRINITY_DN3819_c0_g5_i2.p1 TRINITY_DN3819_c0_g5~~TRINITY_DN3819_c0_g5_i2.p1  ORF type:complete len:592 (+),score=159.23 TRINITY_DN3819_c0_g5_i2:90-1865(+)